MAVNVPYSIEDLAGQLSGSTYTPRTDDELQTAAQNRYASVYNQKRNTAQQNYQTKNLAYERQLAELQNKLIDSRAAVQKNTQDSLASANRYLVNRGMQRSSYGAANAARIESAGQTNLANLLRDYNVNADTIQQNRTLLAQQLADTLAAYDTDMQNDILAYIDEQKQLDYDRGLAAEKYADQLAFELYNLQQAQQKSSGGGGGRRSSGGSSSASASADSNSSSWEQAKAALDAGSHVERVIGPNVAVVKRSGATKDSTYYDKFESQPVKKNTKTTTTSKKATNKSAGRYTYKNGKYVRETK